MNFVEEVNRLGVIINDQQLEKFSIYYKELVETNEKMNLTAITEESEVYKKHFLDSLELLRVIQIGEKIEMCDVGSGAGFPSIPLAIVNDKINVTIIDALNKRINFLNTLSSKINLNNVIALHKRAEDYAKEKREFFDVVTARAVARLNILAELCLPLTKIEGYFIAMKGSTGTEELEEASKAIATLGGKLEKIVSFELPETLDAREIIVIRKIKNTPNKYPRAFAKIKERPL